MDILFLLPIFCICSQIIDENEQYCAISREFKEYVQSNLMKSNESQLFDSYMTINKTEITKISPEIQKSLICVDLGGTNLKIGIAEVKNGEITMLKKQEVPLDGVVAPESMTIYEFIAKRLGVFLYTFPDYPKEGVLTFSFPILKKSANEAIVTKFTKEFKFKRLPGPEDPLKELNLAVSKLGIVFKVIINDSTATVLATLCSHPDTTMALIFGTGINVAYFEKIANVARNNGRDESLTVIITECGGFSGESVKKLRDEIDISLDKQSNSPGEYLAEKIVGGKYFMDYLKGRLMKVLPDYSGFYENLKYSAVRNPDILGILNYEAKEIIKETIEQSTDRKFMVFAALVVGIINTIKDGQGITNHGIGINGSGLQIYSDRIKFENAIKRVLKCYYGEKHDITFNFYWVEDASLIGAAYAELKCSDD